MREGETRHDGDGQIDNPIVGVLEVAVMTSEGSGDPAKLEEMVPDHLSGEALWYTGDTYSSDGGPRGPHVDQGVLAGPPVDAGEKRIFLQCSG